ncbi:hypothetical protein R1sor_020896 [Riccia sorocarpa]|uniref:Uncharacterized protein n=1 Tax=Riccia sorocarpa TaxID=122646 RepID=A0ABD3GFH0_9MARC
MVFPESHPAFIRPIGLSKDKKRPMLLFLLWNGGTLEKYINLEKRSRGRISPEGVRLSNEEFRATVTADEWLNIEIFRKHRMFFYIFLHGIGTRRSQELTLEETMRIDRYRLSSGVPWYLLGSVISDGPRLSRKFRRTLILNPNPRRWIAPELHPRLEIDDEDGNKYMTKFSQESDIYALGWLIREMCGDFFTDMTDEEKHVYNQAVNTRGLHIPNAAEVHGRVLWEGLEKMTWKKICHPYRNQRRTMDYWAHYFNEQLFIDHVTCARPIEYDPRAKVHPDGPIACSLEKS